MRLTKRPSSIGFWRACRLLGDFTSGLVALGATFLIRVNLPLPLTTSLLPADRLSLATTAALLVAASQNVVLYFFGFYEVPRPRASGERLRRLVAATSLQGLLMMSFYFVTGVEFPRTVILLFLPLNLAFLVLSRSLLDRVMPPPKRRAVIVGGGMEALELDRDIQRYHWHGVEIVGHVAPPGQPASDEGPGPLLGTVDDLPDLVSKGIIDDIILTSDSSSWQTALVDRLARRPDARTTILLLPGAFDSLLGRMRYRSIHDIPLIEVVSENEWHTPRPIKRLLDVIAAALFLMLTSPLLAACALAVKLTTRGPVFYSQQRIGRDRRPFVLWKLRTMRADAEPSGEEVLALPEDPRLTRVGRVLRNLRLDELPQLINVLNGTMSLVGPRPERPGFVNKYLAEIPGYAARFSIPPGLTGLAQVNGDYHSSPQNKLRYELAYLSNWSLWLDLVILIRTVKVVLTSRGT